MHFFFQSPRGRSAPDYIMHQVTNCFFTIRVEAVKLTSEKDCFRKRRAIQSLNINIKPTGPAKLLCVGVAEKWKTEEMHNRRRSRKWIYNHDHHQNHKIWKCIIISEVRTMISFNESTQYSSPQFFFFKHEFASQIFRQRRGRALQNRSFTQYKTLLQKIK